MRTICVIVFLLVVPMAGCGVPQLILNFENDPLPTPIDGSAHTMEEVRQAILRACSRRGWSGRVEQEGVIAASIRVRKHTAKIEIRYTDRAISILYRDSTNLNHSGGRIHGKYNHWVATLHRTILRELGFGAQYF